MRKDWLKAAEHIELVYVSPKGMPGDLAIVAAARASFLGELKGEEKDRKLLNRLVKDRHTSPLEMVDFLFCWRTENNFNSLEQEYRFQRQITEDPRWKVTAVRSANFSGNAADLYIRVDASNAAKIIQLLPDVTANPFLYKVEQAIAFHTPWFAEAIGLQLDQPAKVDYPDGGTSVKRENILDDPRTWIEIDDAPSDYQLATLCNGVLDTPLGIRAMYQESTPDFRPMSLLSVSFRLRAPVVVHWQLVRHRTASFAFQSGRYVEFTSEDSFAPKVWRKQSASNKQGSDGEVTTAESRKLSMRLEMRQRALQDDYQQALELGVAKEQARYFLPAWTTLYQASVKMDLMYLQHFLRLRQAPDAQFEIRQYANTLCELWEQKMPQTVSFFKAALVTGKI